jgi:hypothetical protein
MMNMREKKVHYHEMDRYVEIVKEDSLRAKMMNIR